MARHRRPRSAAGLGTAILATTALAALTPPAAPQATTQTLRLSAAEPKQTALTWLDRLLGRQPAAPAGPQQFTIRAAPVDRLYPGATRYLRLTIANPYHFDVKITQLSTEVVRTSRTDCAPTPTNVVVRPYAGPPSLPLVIPANRSRLVGSVPVSMPNTVTDGCQNAEFILKFHGTATKAAK